MSRKVKREIAKTRQRLAVRRKHDGWALHKMAEQNTRLHEALEQIAVVCTDNMGPDCNHRMALDFVRQIANAFEQRGNGK